MAARRSAVRRSRNQYAVYEGRSLVAYLVRHLGDEKWRVHPVQHGTIIPRGGYDTASDAARAHGLEIESWDDGTGKIWDEPRRPWR